MINLFSMNLYMIKSCPHCGGTVVIDQLNCRIFRHGAFSSNNKYGKKGDQMPPHMKKGDCDYLSRNKLIHGCGKPFRINDDMKAIICNYI